MNALWLSISLWCALITLTNAGQKLKQKSFPYKLFEVLTCADHILNKQADVSYWISHGTLLSASRGDREVSPWDSDADVDFLAEDFKIILNAFSNANIHKAKLVEPACALPNLVMSVWNWKVGQWCASDDAEQKYLSYNSKNTDQLHLLRFQTGGVGGHYIDLYGNARKKVASIEGPARWGVLMNGKYGNTPENLLLPTKECSVGFNSSIVLHTRCPAQPEQLLSHTYDNCWMIEPMIWNNNEAVWFKKDDLTFDLECASRNGMLQENEDLTIDESENVWIYQCVLYLVFFAFFSSAFLWFRKHRLAHLYTRVL